MLRWLRASLRLFAIALAVVHTWAAATSYSMNPDGVNYLDIGDAYFRGDWVNAVNTVWSPLYSWILGAVMWLLHPGMRWEFPVVHIVNFVIFLAALLAFEFLWTQLWRARNADRALGAKMVLWPEWAWWSTGYLIFTWASLDLIQIWSVTPDMLMAALVFVAAGLVVRIRAGHDGWQTFGLLGLTLGLAYLSKSIMFPVSLLFSAAAFAAARDLRRSLLGTGMALLVFLLVAGPFVFAISGARGQFTYGEAGKYTYVRHVNGVPYPHWQGQPEGNGTPVHPSRQILDDPPVYEFAVPIGGTYPISYDQSYWYDGVTVRLDWGNQIRQLFASMLVYVDLFVYQQSAILFSVILVYVLRKWGKLPLVDGWRTLLLSLIGLSALLLYAPVLVEGRYVGTFVVLFWSDLLLQARLPNLLTGQRLMSALGVLMAAFLLVGLFMFNVQGFADLTDNRPANAATVGGPSWPGAVAERLWELGVKPGDKVGVIGYGLDSFWARLARTKIVAELLEWQAEPFWTGDTVTQGRVLDAFASAGARAVVAESVPSYARLAGWQQVDDSNYYIYLLDTR